MTERLRFLPAGSDAFLVELADLDATLALFARLASAPVPGVLELVPAARTLMIRFDPLLADRTRLIALIGTLDLSHRTARGGKSFDIPVTYDGVDLSNVAELLGWSVAELIRRHTQATYEVAFTGFAPGFAYMSADDPDFDVPRHPTPRLRIPAGSVALAGKFGGIYPSESPGGWQLIGTTPLALWDLQRPRPALLAPGDRVHFRDMAKGATVPAAALPAPPPQNPKPDQGLMVIRADRPALFQDLGRPGRADQGVARSGALDRHSLIAADLCVGNPGGVAALEITFGGFALRADRPVTLAVTGAPCPLTLRTAGGRTLPAPFGRPFALDAGDSVELGFPDRGMRSYLALRGGFTLETALGSASTDTLAGLGPAPVIAGDHLVPAGHPARAVDPCRPAPPPLPKAGETVTLDIVLGPRTDWFTPKGIETLLTQDWRVTEQSSRVGARLAGARPLERREQAELASEGTPHGAIQVPPSGQPVLFLADHPLTGGYPVIGVVAAPHLDLAGQIPIGASIRFNPIAAFDPLVPETDR